MRKLVVVLGAALVLTAAAQGSWRHEVATDAITGADRSFIAIGATSNPETYVQGELRVICDATRPRGLRVTLELGNWVGLDEMVPVTYRVDDRLPVSLDWVVEPGSEAVTLPDGDVYPLYQVLKSGSQVAFRITVFDGVEWDYLVPVTGFADAASRLGCGRGL